MSLLSRRRQFDKSRSKRKGWRGLLPWAVVQRSAESSWKQGDAIAVQLELLCPVLRVESGGIAAARAELWH